MWLLLFWCHFFLLVFQILPLQTCFSAPIVVFKILDPRFLGAVGYETFLSCSLVRFWCQAFICALFRAFGFRGVVLPAFSLLSCRPFWKLGVNGSFSVGRLTVRILFRNGRGYHFGCFELSIKIMAKTAVWISGSGGSSSTFHLWFEESPILLCRTCNFLGNLFGRPRFPPIQARLFPCFACDNSISTSGLWFSGSATFVAWIVLWGISYHELPKLFSEELCWPAVALVGSCIDEQLYWRAIVLTSSCIDEQLCWPAVVLNGSCIERQLRWPAVVLNGSCVDEQMYWRAVVLASSCIDEQLHW